MDEDELCNCCEEYPAQADGICQACWIDKCVDDYSDD